MSGMAVALPGEPAVDLALAQAQGLSAQEYRRIERLLGRTPTWTELGMFAVMWSEHCSYKSSRHLLAQFKSTHRRVVQGMGENAGAVAIGGGFLVVFKIESHNHPSFIEPYQGAATGVGGILRDIFAMGARPIASLNSLKFGDLDQPHTRHLLRGVVGGIGGYGNCVGVPTVGGEVSFDAAYQDNILVNAFCLGLAREGELQSAKARGVGNPVLYVGAATGRDGIHGASLLASAEFGADQDKRPTVQVGDPFTEKLLIEACLEAVRTGAVVALQDMGAAGLTSSSSEMAARGGLGIELDLDCLPLRESNLTPYEMLLSESQERMLIVVERGRESEIQAVFEKWDLHAIKIGELCAAPRFRVRYRGQWVADLPVGALTDEAPAYDRPLEAITAPPAPAPVQPCPTPAQALRRLLDCPTVASKRWVFRQYDSLVQSNTVLGPGGDAAVIRIKGLARALALSVDSTSRVCARDPYLGAIAAVCKAARNVACVGARPLAISDCLNYGNPERPGVMWQFARGVAGIRDAAAALDTPVVSGNVSFYNETQGRAIPPTPTIAMVGLFEDAAPPLRPWFKVPGEAIVLLRSGVPRLAASEFQALFGGGDELGTIDLARERALVDLLVTLHARGLISSAHDVAEGGLVVALAEACFNPHCLLGAQVALPAPGELWEQLFGEGPSSVIVSLPRTRVDGVLALAAERALQARMIGEVSARPRLVVEPGIDEAVDELLGIYEGALPRRLT
ncbi:MAG TPA: phosphoribosylformylglycinamidine synthase subunit PurL [Candidatus Binataceae bacterium]|nr:phosphoribosylformylglycinamidine synthase subunit PurL [Candidatus Binataceae bacterium]